MPAEAPSAPNATINRLLPRIRIPVASKSTGSKIRRVVSASTTYVPFPSPPPAPSVSMTSSTVSPKTPSRSRSTWMVVSSATGDTQRHESVVFVAGMFEFVGAQLAVMTVPSMPDGTHE